MDFVPLPNRKMLCALVMSFAMRLLAFSFGHFGQGFSQHRVCCIFCLQVSLMHCREQRRKASAGHLSTWPSDSRFGVQHAAENVLA